MPCLPLKIKARLYDAPLARLFLALTTSIAIVVCLLQGEALHTSRQGVDVLKRIADAPKQVLEAIQKDQAIASGSSLPRVTSATLAPHSSTALLRSPTASSVNAPASIPTRARPILPSATTFATTSPAARSRLQSSTSSDEIEEDDEEEEDEEENDDIEEDRRRLKLKRTSSEDGAESEWGFSSLAEGDEISQLEGATRFTVDGVKDSEDRQLVVTAACAEALRRPIIYIERMHTMAFAFVFFEAWTFTLSVVGLLGESRPHLVAVLIAHALAGIYAVFQVIQTQQFHKVFHDDISEGACAGSTAFIPGFWGQTRSFQLGVAIAQGLAFPLVTLVAYKLADRLKWTTFAKTGADRRAARAHTLRLVFEIALLLALFFVVASQSIWLHELFSYPWSNTTRSASPRLLGKVYRGFLVAFTVLLGPLLVAGGIAVRQQRKRLLIAFLAGNLVFLAHTVLLSTQRLYMMTSSAFRFLTFTTAVAVVLTSATLILGVLCLFHIECRRKQKNMTVDWVSTSFPSESSSTDSRAQGVESDVEKALEDNSTATDEPWTPFDPDLHHRRSTIFVTLPTNTRRVASLANCNDGSAPSATTRTTGTFSSSSTLSPANSLSRTPSTPTSSSSSSSASFSSNSSPTRSRPKPLLRINTTSAQANQKILKGVVAINPDALVLLEGGDLGAGVGGEEKSRWSESTKATGSDAARERKEKDIEGAGRVVRGEGTCGAGR